MLLYPRSFQGQCEFFLKKKKKSCFVYLVHQDWPDCKLLPACPSCPPRSSHLPAMKGSPVRTTSEPEWKYESSLKGRIELLQSERSVRVRKEKQKRQQEKQYSHTMKLQSSASKISKVFKLLKCTMTILP